VRLTESIHDGKSTVMLSPQYLSINQLRIEFDQKITEGHWITLAPHYVQDMQQYKEQNGFGLVATYKYFLRKTPLYFGVGGQFTQNTYENYAFDNTSKTKLWMYQSKALQYGPNILSGSYFRVYPYLFIDLYYGLGYRFTKLSSSDGLDHFDRSFLGYDYSGVALLFGVRIGVML
jgi:hypothetical protein